MWLWAAVGLFVLALALSILTAGGAVCLDDTDDREDRLP